MPDISLVNTVFPSGIKVPPQGQLYLTSSLEQAGFSVDLRDYQHCSLPDPWRPETLAAFADGDSPLVGLSAMSYALPLVIEAARSMKRARPERRIVLGGIGPSAVAARLLEFCPDLDAVVIGEGERTAVELTRALLDGEDLAAVAGIAYRDAAGVHVTRERPRIGALDEIPWPAYDRVDLSRYRIVDIQFGRGCPYDCSFCDIAPYWGRKHTRRPVESFVDELESLVRGRGVREVFVVDDTFVLSRPLVEQICAEIIARRLEVSWGCYARVDLMSDRLLARMAEAGCRKIFYGVESGSDAVLRRISKDLTAKEITRVVRKSLEHIPYVTTSFVWGFPDETMEDLEETVALLLYFAALGACPQLNLALPYSYSSLYREHRDRLVFSPEHSSQLTFYEGDRSWITALVARDREFFSAFYRLPVEGFERRWDYLCETGLSPHEVQRAFDHPVAAE